MVFDRFGGRVGLIGGVANEASFASGKGYSRAGVMGRMFVALGAVAVFSVEKMRKYLATGQKPQ